MWQISGCGLSRYIHYHTILSRSRSLYTLPVTCSSKLLTNTGHLATIKPSWVNPIKLKLLYSSMIKLAAIAQNHPTLMVISFERTVCYNTHWLFLITAYQSMISWLLHSQCFRRPTTITSAMPKYLPLFRLSTTRSQVLESLTIKFRCIHFSLGIL